MSAPKRRWRFYRTEDDHSPVADFLNMLPAEDAAAVAIAMKAVTSRGLAVARHLRGDIYEVRATAPQRAFRILFATEGRYSQILLALEGFAKTTQKTPPAKIALAERRLADWRRRGAAR